MTWPTASFGFVTLVAHSSGPTWASQTHIVCRGWILIRDHLIFLLSRGDGSTPYLFYEGHGKQSLADVVLVGSLFGMGIFPQCTGISGEYDLASKLLGNMTWMATEESI